jgi:predicted ATPase
LDALGGQGAVVVIEGRAGFGKTRLLAEALSRADDEGIRTALGRADVDESVMPLSPLLSACFSC